MVINDALVWLGRQEEECLPRITRIARMTGHISSHRLDLFGPIHLTHLIHLIHVIHVIRVIRVIRGNQ